MKFKNTIHSHNLIIYRKGHRKTQSQSYEKARILNQIEESKEESIEFEKLQQRKHRLLAEKQVERLAKEKPALLNEKSKEIIMRINEQGVLKTNKLASLSQGNK